MTPKGRYEVIFSSLLFQSSLLKILLYQPPKLSHYVHVHTAKNPENL